MQNCVGSLPIPSVALHLFEASETYAYLEDFKGDW